jgi:hypothetical protein
VIWAKDIFVLGRSKYQRRYEPIWYGWNTKGKSAFCGLRDLDDVWEIPRPRTSDEHPTTALAACRAKQYPTPTTLATRRAQAAHGRLFAAKLA